MEQLLATQAEDRGAHGAEVAAGACREPVYYAIRFLLGLQNSCRNNFRKNVTLEQCKGVHCVDLGESFQTHIFLQKLASIQPKTSPVKFARSIGAASRFHSPPGHGSSGAMRSAQVILSGILEALQGSFSAVSKRNFASKYAFESSRRDLHNALLCTDLKSHVFS